MPPQEQYFSMLAICKENKTYVCRSSILSYFLITQKHSYIPVTTIFTLSLSPLLKCTNQIPIWLLERKPGIRTSKQTEQAGTGNPYPSVVISSATPWMWFGSPHSCWSVLPRDLGKWNLEPGNSVCQMNRTRSQRELRAVSDMAFDFESYLGRVDCGPELNQSPSGSGLERPCPHDTGRGKATRLARALCVQLWLLKLQRLSLSFQLHASGLGKQ